MAGVAFANPDIICSGTDVKRMTVYHALSNGPLKCPPLQRRYCWGRKQVATFVHDICTVATPALRAETEQAGSTLQQAAEAPAPFGRESHSFGRLLISTTGPHLVNTAFKTGVARTNAGAASGDTGASADAGTGGKGSSVARSRPPFAAAAAAAAASRCTPRRTKKRKAKLLIDGQQRVTTVALFLAAVRDAALAAPPDVLMSARAVTTKNEQVAAEIDRVLSMMGLKPTYLDRAPFAAAISRASMLGDCAGGSDQAGGRGHGSSNTAGGNAIAAAKELLDAEVARAIRKLRTKLVGKQMSQQTTAFTTPSVCALLVRAVLFRCTVLWFAAVEPDTFAVYERLAIREMGLLTMMANNSPGVKMFVLYQPNVDPEDVFGVLRNTAIV
eukprot:gene11105-16355_t